MFTITPTELTFLACGLFTGSLIAYILNRFRLGLLLRARQLEEDSVSALFKERLQTMETDLLEQKTAYRQLQDLLEAKTEENYDLKGQVLVNRERLAELERRKIEAKACHQDQTQLFEQTRRNMADTFKALAAETFKNNNRLFLDLANQTLSGFHNQAQTDYQKQSKAIAGMLDPITASLGKVDEQIRQVEKERVHAYAGLSEQIKLMMSSHNQLQAETANLVHSLRTPAVRGRWGEIQLKRVVELAGMLEYCDFYQQVSVNDDTGSRLRPDMTIRLPNQKEIVVDSKTVLQAYLDASEASNEEIREQKLSLHAEHVKNQIKQLAAKSYWQQFSSSPEFVVLFLPGENFFSAALKKAPDLIEYGVSRRVIIATPTTLIALLRAVSYGWRHDRLTENAKTIGELGKTLHERIRTMTTHFEELRKGLERVILSYNKTVASMESRVMVTARKLNDIDPLIDREIPVLTPVESAPRELQQPEP